VLIPLLQAHLFLDLLSTATVFFQEEGEGEGKEGWGKECREPHPQNIKGTWSRLFFCLKMMAGMEVDDGPARVGSKRNYQRSGNTGSRSHSQQICRYWQEGRCLKGDECQWLHPGNAGTTGRGASLGNGRRTINVIDNRSENRGGWGSAGGGSGGGGFSTGSSQGRSRNVSARWGRPRNAISRPGQRDRGHSDASTGPQRSTKAKPCNFWLKGNCNRGDDCIYLHAHTTALDVEMMTQLIGHEKVAFFLQARDGCIP
jgi:hypothetical protein